MMTLRMLPIDKAPSSVLPLVDHRNGDVAWLPLSEGLIVDVRFMAFSHFSEPRLLTQKGGI